MSAALRNCVGVMLNMVMEMCRETQRCQATPLGLRVEYSA
jgi:hypothetical protein